MLNSTNGLEVLVGHKMAVIIDAGTSRLKVNSAYIDVCKEVLTEYNLSKYAIGIVLGPRLDLMDALMERCQQTFKNGRTVLIQLTAGATQRLGKSLPSFLILVHSDTNIPLPYSAELLKYRSDSLEQPRLRCMTKSCCFRSTTEKALLISILPLDSVLNVSSWLVCTPLPSTIAKLFKLKLGATKRIPRKKHLHK